MAFATGLPPDVPDTFAAALVRERAGESRFHNVSRPLIRVAKEVRIDCQRDRRITVTEAPAHRDNIDSCCNELGSVRVAASMQRNVRQLQAAH